MLNTLLFVHWSMLQILFASDFSTQSRSGIAATPTNTPHMYKSIEKYLTEGRRKDGVQYSGHTFWMVDWVVNICATFRLCTPLSCFPAFARSLSVFRWPWYQGLYTRSSHACPWKRLLRDSELHFQRWTKHSLKAAEIMVQNGKYVK